MPRSEVLSPERQKHEDLVAVVFRKPERCRPPADLAPAERLVKGFKAKPGAQLQVQVLEVEVLVGGACDLSQQGTTHSSPPVLQGSLHAKDTGPVSGQRARIAGQEQPPGHRIADRGQEEPVQPRVQGRAMASTAGRTCSSDTGMNGKPTAPPALDTSRQQATNWSGKSSSTKAGVVSQRSSDVVGAVLTAEACHPNPGARSTPDAVRLAGQELRMCVGGRRHGDLTPTVG